MMNQLYYRLRDWFDDTFGKNREPEEIILKLEEEVGELIAAVRRYENGLPPNKQEINEELADVTMVLFHLAQRYGMCYNAFMDNIIIKHNVNRKRNWIQQPDGTWKGFDK